MQLFQLIKKVFDCGKKANLGFLCVATRLAGFPDFSILWHPWLFPAFVRGNDTVVINFYWQCRATEYWLPRCHKLIAKLFEKQKGIKLLREKPTVYLS